MITLSKFNKNLHEIKTKLSGKIAKVINEYSFLFFSEISDFILSQKNKTNIQESEAIIINQYSKTQENDFLLIVGFKNTIIIITRSLIYLLNQIFNINTKTKIYFLENTKDILNQHIIIQNPQIECDDYLKKLINEFNKNALNQIDISIRSCITGFLILQGFAKLNKNQTFSYILRNETYEPKKFDENDYIELDLIGTGSSNIVRLIFLIETQDLCVIKKLNPYSRYELHERELNNYKKLFQIPWIPKLYGTDYKNECLIIQYIKGNTLDIIEEKRFSFNDKIIIIFQLLVIFHYLHKKNFIYRDLKPNNIIIDDNKNVFLIDFDRLISYSENILDEEHTNYFSSDYVAPEILNGNISYACDIYSLGKIIYYVMKENNIEQNPDLYSLYKSCIDDSPSKRPSSSDLLFLFYLYFIDLIRNSAIYNSSTFDFYDDIINDNHQVNIEEIDKVIHYLSLAADKNYKISQRKLGILYYFGKYVKQDFKKSIHYLKLAADQNDTEAQNLLGLAYCDANNPDNELNKGIQYLTLAADQNNLNAQINLANIFRIIEKDYEKAIHYYTLAANQNHPYAQLKLGNFYLKGIHIKKDINKAIHYFNLAVNQNHPYAQLKLGNLYLEGIHINKDINKAIFFFTLSANQNVSQSQYELGLIYSEGKYVPRDINKALSYYLLAAKQNHPDALYNIAVIYSEGRFVNRDINKAIKYFLLASNQNVADANYDLFAIYCDDEYLHKDINKAIHYLKIAANQGHSYAQLKLQQIYKGQYSIQDEEQSIHRLILEANNNNPNSQFELGRFYYEGVFIQRDIEKAIHYLTLASKNNILFANYYLGEIFLYGQYVKQDIYKSAYYLKLAADQNNKDAQMLLGYIYLTYKDMKHDINESIYYFKLAANQNQKNAQFFLGLIYSEDEYNMQDIDKAIHYYSLSAKQNFPVAYFNLFLIYFNIKFNRLDITKALHNLTLAAKLNHSFAQFTIGCLYLKGLFLTKNINKGIDYINQASINGFKKAHFMIGYFYHEGKSIGRDIQKTIYHYKEASSFNIFHAKNNLGIIYKNGIENDIRKIEYFNESIKRFNDYLSMFNLAHIYIYEFNSNEKIDEAITLLIKSSFQYFINAIDLLLIAIVKKFGYDLNEIKKNIFLIFEKIKICEKIKIPENIKIQLYEIISFHLTFIVTPKKFQKYYEDNRDIDFLYDYKGQTLISKRLFQAKENQQTNNKANNVTKDFYDGFGFNFI